MGPRRTPSTRPRGRALLALSGLVGSTLTVGTSLVGMAPAGAATEPDIEFQQASGVTFPFEVSQVFTTRVGDVDGDGRKDLVNAGKGNLPGIGYRGWVTTATANPDGSFDTATKIFDFPETGGNPGAGAIGWYAAAEVLQVIGGPELDIVATGMSDRNLFILEGNGDGTFDAPVALPITGFSPGSLLTADLNGDATPDFVSNGGLVSAAFVSTSPTTWTEQSLTIAGGATPQSYFTAWDVSDADGDTDLDLVIAGDSRFNVLPNDGTGVFGAAIQSPLSGTWGISLGDYDEDGDEDAMVASPWDVYLQLNDGTGQFATPAGPVFPNIGGALDQTSHHAADLDGDGNLDYWVARNYTNITIFWGAGDGTFTLDSWSPGPGSGLSPSYFQPYDTFAADVDGDGRLDLAVSGVGPRSSVMYQDPVTPRKFSAAHSYRDSDERQVFTNQPALALADFTNDGDLDLVYQYNFGVHNGPLGIRMRPGDGNGGFGPFQNIGTIGGCGLHAKIYSRDFDNDGNPDVMCSGGLVGAGFTDATGAIVAGAPILVNTGGYGGVARNHAFADFNADGKTDVASFITNSCCPFGEPWIGGITVNLYDTANPRNFIVTDPNGINLGSGLNGPGPVVAGDFDNDGKADIIATKAPAGAERIRFYKGKGDGTFFPEISSQPGLDRFKYMEAADLDGDGNLDLYGNVETGPGGLEVLPGNGDGTFGPKANYAGDTYSGYFVHDDLDGDGIPDYAGTSWQSGVVVLAGRADGTFGANDTFDATTPREESLQAGDLDGDGRKELVVGNGGVFTVLHNTSPDEPITGPPDLSITSITAPASIEAGVVGDVTYTVKNFTGPIIGGNWVDRAYLSADAQWSPDDRMIASAARSGDLLSGASYTQTLTAPFIPATDGPQYVIVRTDVFDQVEELDEGDDARTKPGPIDVVIPTLDPGSPETLTMGDGDLRYRRIEPSGGVDQLLQVSGTAPDQSQFGLGNNRIPTFTDYDLAPADATGEMVTLPSASGSTDRFLVVRGRTAAGSGASITLDLHNVDYEITSFAPNAGSNAGSITIAIDGGGFADPTGARLRKGGTDLVATSVSRTSSTHLEAKFDLSSAALGDWDVVVTNAGGEAVAEAKFTVTDEPPGKLVTLLSTPESIRVTSVGTATITYRNTGGTEFAVPILELKADGAFMASPSGGPSGSVARILPLAGPSDVIPPHTERQVTVNFSPTAEAIEAVKDGGEFPINFTLNVIAPDDTTPFDFAARIDPLKPPALPDAAWTEVKSFVAPTPPTTLGGWVQLISGFRPGAVADGVAAADVDAILGWAVNRGLALAPGAPIHGTVTGEGGGPVADPELTVTPKGVNDPTAGFSWHDGSFNVWNIPSGDYEVHIDGRQVRSGPVSVPTTGVVPVEVADAATLTGIVRRTGDNKPVGGALVTVTPPTGHPAARTLTDDDGFYRFTGLDAGPVMVGVSALGYMSPLESTPTLEAGANVTDLTVVSGGGVSGTVTDGSAPIEDATIVATAVTPAGATQGGAARTDENGAYTITGLASGDYTITARSPGKAAGVQTPVTVTGTTTTSGIDFALGAGSTLTGQVGSSEGGPLAGVQIVSDVPTGAIDAVFTDASGTFSIPGWPAGGGEVTALLAGRVPGAVTVAAGVLTANLELRPENQIHGRITSADGSTPVPGLLVTVNPPYGPPKQSVTDSAGDYRVTGLGDGDHEVMVNPGVATVAVWDRQTVTLSPSVTDPAADFTFDTADITGVVHDSDGGPVHDASVYLIDSAGRVVDQAYTDVAGSYRFVFRTLGTYSFVAHGEDIGFVREDGVVIGAGDGTGPTLEPASAGADLTIHATDGGADLADAQVWLHAPAALGLPAAVLTASTAADGRATFAGLAPGTYPVEIRADGFQVMSQDVVVAGADLQADIGLTAGLDLTGTVLGPDGPLEAVVVNAVDPATGHSATDVTDAAGSYSFDSLTAGPYDVWAVTSGLRPSRTSGVVPGPAATANLLLASTGATVEGTITDEGGDPVLLARVNAIDLAGNLLQSTISDSDGTYTLDLLPEVPIFISADGTMVDGVVAPVTPSNAGPTTIDLVVPSVAAMAINDVSDAYTLPAARDGARRPAWNGEFDDGQELSDLGPADPASLWWTRSGKVPPPQRASKDTDAFRLKWRDYITDDKYKKCPPLLDAANDAALAWKALDKSWSAWESAFKAMNEWGAAEQNLALAKSALVGAKAIKSLMDIKQSLAGQSNAIDQALKDGKISADSAAKLKELAIVLKDLIPAIADQFSKGDTTSFNFLVKGVLKPLVEDSYKNGVTAAVAALTKVPAGVDGNALGLGRLKNVLGNIGKAPLNGMKLFHTVNSFIKLKKEVDEAYDNINNSKQLYDTAQDSYIHALRAYLDKLARLEALSRDCSNPTSTGGGNKSAGSVTRLINSKDPNQITGPAGAGPLRLVGRGQHLPYTIDFENDPDASAAAQRVVVTHVLDADLDLDTFELGDLGWGAIQVDVPEGRHDYTTSVPIEGTGYSVKVEATLDADTRTVTWTFTTIDPLTGDLPIDALAGFLPPNDTAPEGEGWVTFTTKVRDDATVGNTVDAVASIVFDENPAITTNTHTNLIGVTIDQQGPTFHPLTPARILDTRDGIGTTATPVGPGETRSLAVADHGGVPASGASAVVINMTVTGPTAASHLTVWPGGATMPATSSLNFRAGETVPNLVVVGLDAAGTLQYRNNSGSVHVIGDVVGWFDSTVGGLAPPGSPPAGATYHGMTPNRILDSRDGIGTPAIPWSAADTRDVVVRGGATGVPANATAVVLNMTVTQPTQDSHLTVWPKGVTKPTASSLNFSPGLTIANAVTVPVGSSDSVSIYNNSGLVHVIADVVGYFSPDDGGTFTAIAPFRKVDSRDGTGTTDAPWGAAEARDVTVTGGPSGVPSDATAVLVNITAVSPSATSHLRVWPTGVAMPLASSLNFDAGHTLPNLVWARVGTNGQISIYNNSGSVEVIVDIVGYMSG